MEQAPEERAAGGDKGAEAAEAKAASTQGVWAAQWRGLRVLAFARNAATRNPINGGSPVLSGNALNAKRQ